MSTPSKLAEPFDTAAKSPSAEIVELFPAKKPAKKRARSAKPAMNKAAKPKSTSAEISAAGQALLDKPRQISGPGPREEQPAQIYHTYRMMPQPQHIGGLLFKK